MVTARVVLACAQKRLVAVLDLRNALSQMNAAEALAVLAARSDDNRKAITAANAVEPLVRLMGDGRRVRASTPQESAAAVLAAASGGSGDAPGSGGANSVPAGFVGYDAATAPGLSDLEQWYVYMVNAEYARSKQGKWRRLFPSARSSEYFQFLDPTHRFHFLPYGV